MHVVSASTGLMVYGTGEWLVETHGERGIRTWRKLHLAVDPDSGEILASELTSTDEGDAFQVGPLLEQVPGPLASVTADGAYGGVPTTTPWLGASPTRLWRWPYRRARPRCRARTPASHPASATGTFR